MAFEMALKKGKPMIMADDDVLHFNSMFTGCNEKFRNSREACTMIIEGAYMSDVHIDFFNSRYGIAMVNGQEAKNVDYPRLVRPPSSSFDKEKALRESSYQMKMMAL